MNLWPLAWLGQLLRREPCCQDHTQKSSGAAIRNPGGIHSVAIL